VDKIKESHIKRSSQKRAGVGQGQDIPLPLYETVYYQYMRYFPLKKIEKFKFKH